MQSCFLTLRLPTSDALKSLPSPRQTNTLGLFRAWTFEIGTVELIPCLEKVASDEKSSGAKAPAGVDATSRKPSCRRVKKQLCATPLVPNTPIANEALQNGSPV